MSPSVAGSAQSSSVTAITSSPASSASWAAAALSTPPLMATRVRRSFGSSLATPARAAWPSARWRASAVSSAAWRFEGVNPPSAFAMSSVLKLHALRNGRSSMSSTVALAAAVSAPQPSASKPASTIVSPSMRTAMRTRSPQAAPPAAPVWGQPARAPLPEGASRCSANDRTERESYRAPRSASPTLSTFCIHVMQNLEKVAPACRCRIR